jgi:zinc transport system substrate-binding protein
MPVPPGVDPPFWRPRIQDIAAMQQADLIFLNGANLEKWLTQATLPRLKLVDTSAGFRDRFITIENAVTHSHGPEGAHSHSGIAYTTWLDFDLASRQAEAVARAMALKRPAQQRDINEKLAGLTNDLEALDKELKVLTATKPDLPLMGSHPVYQYLARRYGLKLRAVHWEPDTMPAETEWAELKRTLAVHKAHWMLWEAQPTTEIAARLNTLGVQSVVYDPCGSRPGTGDFMTVMRANLDNMRQVFK